MRSNFLPFEVAAAAVLLPGFMVMPALAADPSLRGPLERADKDRAAARPVVDHQTRSV